MASTGGHYILVSQYLAQVVLVVLIFYQLANAWHPSSLLRIVCSSPETHVIRIRPKQVIDPASSVSCVDRLIVVPGQGMNASMNDAHNLGKLGMISHSPRMI